MKKFNVKKIGLFIILVILVGGLLILYNSANGNPISKYIARNRYEDYLKKEYGERDFKIQEVYYNFKNSNYYCKVVSEKEGLYFTISLSKNGEMNDEYKENPNLVDVELSNKFANSVEDRIKDELKGKISFISNEKESFFVFAHFNILQGKYKDRNTKFSNEMDDPFAINLELSSMNPSDYRNQLIDIGEALRNFAIENEYKGLKGIYINCYVDDKPYYLLLKKESFSEGKEKLENYIGEGRVSYGGEKGIYGDESFNILNTDELEKK